MARKASEIKDDDLAELFGRGTVTIIKIGGEEFEFEIGKFRLEHFERVSALLSSVAQSENVERDLQGLIDRHGPEVVDLVAQVANVTPAFVRQMPAAALVDLLGHVVEVNADFFIHLRRLMSRASRAMLPPTSSAGGESSSGLSLTGTD